MQTQTNLENVLKNNIFETQDSKELIMNYKKLDSQAQKKADNLFYSICGISLNNLIADHESHKVQ